MSSIFKPILPIPEEVVVGSGSYVIPANKYAYFQAHTAAAAAGSNDHNGAGGSVGTSGGASCAIEQWLIAGSSITTTLTTASASTSSNDATITSTSDARVSVNGTIICSAIVACRVGTSGSANTTAAISGSSRAGWSAAIFPIPKNNLPSQLIEGN